MLVDPGVVPSAIRVATMGAMMMSGVQNKMSNGPSSVEKDCMDGSPTVSRVDAFQVATTDLRRCSIAESNSDATLSQYSPYWGGAGFGRRC